MRRFAALSLIGSVALASLGVTMPREAAVTPTQEVVSTRSKKAVKRARLAQSQSRIYRSRGKPPKRKLHRNMVRHSQRVRRKHRRAA